jgi:hypothetical protein
MKGVTIMTEESTGKKIAQIDLSLVAKNSAAFEDFFDRLIAESRKGEKDIPWSSIKSGLKKKK